ncbi:MAG: transcriptional regulator, MarR family [Phenylobacterium sp.]|nr:transcriptional regulator, MarR family [Phenylobacterium sp.]
MYTVTVEAKGQDVRAALAQSLLLAGRRWRVRLNERLKRIGQTDARCAALAEISGWPDGIVQRELSQRLGVEEPTVVRLLDALEASGWVERRAHSLDRRAKIVHATAAARPVLDEALGILGELHEEMFADIDPADLAVCVRVLNELTRKLGR